MESKISEQPVPGKQFRCRVTSEIVEKALSAKDIEVPLPPLTIVPFALVQVLDQPLEELIRRMETVLSIGDAPGISTWHFLLGRVVLLWVSA